MDGTAYGPWYAAAGADHRLVMHMVCSCPVALQRTGVRVVAPVYTHQGCNPRLFWTSTSLCNLHSS